MGRSLEGAGDTGHGAEAEGGPEEDRRLPAVRDAVVGPEGEGVLPEEVGVFLKSETWRTGSPDLAEAHA